MIHIFDLTPESTVKELPPNKDFVRFLPGCDTGGRYGVCNWFKYPLGVSWSLDSSEDVLRNQNRDIWRRIVDGIEKRVNDDNDSEDAIDVFCVVKTRVPGLLATVVAARNDYLESLIDEKVSQETFDLAYKYTKIWVPVSEQMFLSEEERDRDRKNRAFRWRFICWTQI